VTCTASRRRARPQDHCLARRRHTARSVSRRPRGLPGAHRYEVGNASQMLDTFTNEQVSDTARAATRGDACAGASTFAALQTGVLVATRVEIWGGGWRGRRGVLLLAQLRQPCEACVASARQPPILDAGAPVVGAGDLPAPRPKPARIPSPGLCAPAPASASATGPAEARPTSDRSRPYYEYTNPKSSSLPNFRFQTDPLTAQTLPSTAPQARGVRRIGSEIRLNRSKIRVKLSTSSLDPRER